MLDRATACLKAGARDSLKCARQASHSQRQLHRSFWTHGVGDLDLPCSGTSSRRLPPDSTSKNTLANERCTVDPQNRHEPDRGGSELPDGPFLDFLYPPQALAWLQNTRRSERQQVRNFRRVCEVPTQRRKFYTRSVTRSSAKRQNEDEVPEEQGNTTEQIVKEGQEAPDEFDLPGQLWKELEEDESKKTGDTAPAVQKDASVDEKGRADPPANFASAVKGLLSEAPGKRSRDEASDTGAEVSGTHSLDFGEDDSHTQDSHHGMFADSPADLAEAAHSDADSPEIFSGSESPLRSLQRLMAGATVLPRGEDKAAGAWAMYSNLSEGEKADRRLKTEFLTWLSTFETPIADAHCISLYLSLPLTQRTLHTYKLVLACFIRRRDMESALGLHREALRNIPNGHQITYELFWYAARRVRLDMAEEIKNEHDNHYATVPHSNQQALFWLGIAEMPDLVKVAVKLVHVVYGKRYRYGLSIKVSEHTPLVVKLAEEAISRGTQVFAPLDESGAHIRSTSITEMVKFITEFSENARGCLESFLASTMERFDRMHKLQVGAAFARGYHVICSVYIQYRNLPGARLPESILLPLLRELSWRESDISKAQEGPQSLSAQQVVLDWEKWHGRLSAAAIIARLRHFSSAGKVAEVRRLFEDLQQFPYFEQKKAFYTLVYTHARRADLPKAIETFNEVKQMASDHDDKPDLKCWNVLMHACQRVDDLEQALALIQQLVREKVQPDVSTVHPVLAMLSSRGEVADIEKILDRFSFLSKSTEYAACIGSHIRAYINCGDMESAKGVLEAACEKVRTGKMHLPLTEPFNNLLTGFVRQRDVEGTMRTYAWMKTAKIYMNGFTYSALMQGLVYYRQTLAAHGIMKNVMSKAKIKPVAFHYAILMAGYTNQGMLDEALKVHETMMRKNVRHTVASRKIYLKLSALLQQRDLRRLDYKKDRGEPVPLNEVIQQLQQVLLNRDGSELAPKQPTYGFDVTGHGQDIGEYAEPILWIHGVRRCLEAVVEIFRQYRVSSVETGQSPDPPPMRILAALMRTLVHAKNYAKVEELWIVAKQQAEQLAYNTPTVTDGWSRSVEETADSPESTVAAEANDSGDAAEIGFSAILETDDSSASTTMSSTEQSARRLSPGLRYILSRPLLEYLKALREENRTGDMVRTVSQLVEQGYVFDIYTWNRLIEYLCRSEPPLILLAYTLTERFLIKDFPGWSRIKGGIPRKSEVAQQLEHIRARYLPPSKIMPHYETMLHLASGLIWLRRTETVSGRLLQRQLGDFYRLVGSVADIRMQAPRTLIWVERIPYIEDRLQRRLLRPEKR